MEITHGVLVHRVAAEVEVEVEVEVEEEAATNVTITTTEKIASGKYSKRRRSNVVVSCNREKSLKQLVILFGFVGKI